MTRCSADLCEESVEPEEKETHGKSVSEQKDAELTSDRRGAAARTTGFLSLTPPESCCYSTSDWEVSSSRHIQSLLRFAHETEMDLIFDKRKQDVCILAAKSPVVCSRDRFPVLRHRNTVVSLMSAVVCLFVCVRARLNNS